MGLDPEDALKERLNAALFTAQKMATTVILARSDLLMGRRVDFVVGALRATV